MDFLNQNPREVCIFSEHSGYMGVHTFSIVESGDGGFYGYSGTKHTGPIDLWKSSDMERWRRVKKNPVINEFGVRWASVIRNKNRIYMATRAPYKNVTGGSLRKNFEKFSRRSRILNYIGKPFEKFDDITKTSVALFSSKDGKEFKYIGDIADESTSGLPVNQNPSLFYSTNLNKFILIYYTGHRYYSNKNRWEIRIRKGNTPEKIKEGGGTVILSKNRPIAAPSLEVIKDNYILFTETIRDGKWATEYHISKDLFGPYDSPENNILYEDDRACASPYVYDNSLYIFVSEKKRSGMFEYWVGKLHKYSIN